MKKNKRKRSAKRTSKVSANKLFNLAMEVGNQMAERAFPKLTPVPSRVRFLQQEALAVTHYLKPGERYAGQADSSKLCPALRTGAGFAIDPAILNAWNNGRV